MAVKSEILMHFLQNKGGVDIVIELTAEHRVFTLRMIGIVLLLKSRLVYDGGLEWHSNQTDSSSACVKSWSAGR